MGALCNGILDVMPPTARIVDGNENAYRYEAENNLMAVCLQHEIDHLHGVTMLDHLGPMKRVAKMRELQEALAAGARPGDTESDMR